MFALCLLFLALPLAQSQETLDKCDKSAGYVLIAIENSEETDDDELDRMKQAAKDLILRLPIGTGPGQTRVMVKSFDEEVFDVLGDDTQWIEEPLTAEELDDVFSDLEAGSFSSADIPVIVKNGLDILSPLEDLDRTKTHFVFFLNDENYAADRKDIRNAQWEDRPASYWQTTTHAVVPKPLIKGSDDEETVVTLTDDKNSVMYLDSENIVKELHMNIMTSLEPKCLACPKPPKVDLTIVIENYKSFPREKEGVRFEPFKNLTKTVVSRFSRYDFNDIRYGVVQFGDRVDRHLSLTDRLEDVQEFITSLKYQSTENRDLGKALKYVVENTMNSNVVRPDAKKIVLIYSSLTTFDEDVVKYAKMARDQGMEIMFHSIDTIDRRNVNEKITQMTYSIDIASFDFQADDYVKSLTQDICIMGRFA